MECQGPRVYLVCEMLFYIGFPLRGPEQFIFWAFFDGQQTSRAQVRYFPIEMDYLQVQVLGRLVRVFPS